MIDDDGNEEVRPAHAGEDEPGERTEGPESHLELTLGLLRVFDGEIEAEPTKSESEGGKNAKNDEKDIVRQIEFPS